MHIINMKLRNNLWNLKQLENFQSLILGQKKIIHEYNWDKEERIQISNSKENKLKI